MRRKAGITIGKNKMIILYSLRVGMAAGEKCPKIPNALGTSLLVVINGEAIIKRYYQQKAG